MLKLIVSALIPSPPGLVTSQFTFTSSLEFPLHFHLHVFGLCGRTGLCADTGERPNSTQKVLVFCRNIIQSVLQGDWKHLYGHMGHVSSFSSVRGWPGLLLRILVQTLPVMYDNCVLCNFEVFTWLYPTTFIWQLTFSRNRAVLHCEIISFSQINHASTCSTIELYPLNVIVQRK